MNLNNLKSAVGSTHTRKSLGRGQGSGLGKTAGKGHKGAKARSGYKIKVGFEGGQQPLQKRLPKVGFTSRKQKPLVVNVDKVTFLDGVESIDLSLIRSFLKIPQRFTSVKLIGKKVSLIADKINDKAISCTRNVS